MSDVGRGRDLGLTVWPVRGVPEVVAGDDLAELLIAGLRASGLSVQNGDVLVVTSKVVSKALGLRAPGADRRPAVARETVRIVAERATSDGPTRIVEGRCGVVAAAAGVDSSNTGPSGEILLLPEKPDDVAADLHARLAALLPEVSRLGVILSDTAGRPWRAGQIDFALGAHGLRVLDDHRGRRDADGRALAVTAIAIADELAAAADLVKGKSRGIAAALVRGAAQWVLPVDGTGADDPGTDDRWRDGAARLIRTGPGDFFALGHVEAARAALGHPPGSASSERIGIRAIGVEPLRTRVARAVALALTDPSTGMVEFVGQVEVDHTVNLHCPDPYPAGRLAARLEVALWSEGLTGSVTRTEAGLHLYIHALTAP
ncbi:MAG: coenzyme F420-0:L-glutamate ligase [Tetrasphaera sp.]